MELPQHRITRYIICDKLSVIKAHQLIDKNLADFYDEVRKIQLAKDNIPYDEWYIICPKCNKSLLFDHDLDRQENIVWCRQLLL
jgi:hypothetical protein